MQESKEIYGNENGEEFRDKIATVDESGKRIWIYPKQPKGPFYNYRKYVSYILLIVLFGLPFVKVNDQPFMLFNILEAKFILFGVYFAPQDFHLFVIAMLIGFIFIALFTVVYGRLFCGWVCPQTIFMEMVFRRIEYWIEGDANAQKRLNKKDWDTDKLIRKSIKHLIFILISVFIAHTFLSYIIGLDEVMKIVSEPIAEHWGGFIAMVVFTAAFYGVFSLLREQVCTTICPYGRMQGVLLDQDSLAVSYDFVRGEPRGKINKKESLGTKPKGDCIDCGLCVQVCPTGIDIRNGTQLECVNCTACMDACDEVMLKINRPTGLIRIDSYNGIVNKTKSVFSSRAIAYSFVLVALMGIEGFLFSTRSAVEVLFLRTPGMLYQDNDDGYISNLYNYQLINKTDEAFEVNFSAVDFEGVDFQYVGEKPRTKPNGNSEGAVFVRIPKGKVKGRKNNLIILTKRGDQQIDKTKTTFFGPNKNK